MSSYAPAWGFGGPIRLMYEYARWLAEEGCKVITFTGDVHHDYTRLTPSREVLDGITIERIPIAWRHLVRYNINLVSPAMLFRSARLIYRSTGPVIIHICEMRGLVPLYGTLLKRLFPSRVTLVHSAFGMLHHKRSRLRDVYDRIVLAPQLRSIDLGLAQNKHEQNRYREIFARVGARNSQTKLFPLHMENRENPTSDGKEPCRHQLRQRYQIDQNALVVMFLGRLHPEKGIQRTIDAFLKFRTDWAQPSYLLIIGRDDGEQAKIEAHIQAHQAEDHIRIINNVYQERFDYYTLADVFVGFPTIYEETMLASVEALGCSTPVLVSQEADIPFVEQEQAGFVINFDLDVASTHLRMIAENLGDYRRRAASTATRHFSEHSARRRFLEQLSITHNSSLSP